MMLRKRDSNVQQPNANNGNKNLEGAAGKENAGLALKRNIADNGKDLGAVKRKSGSKLEEAKQKAHLDNVPDYDKEMENDVTAVALYAKDIFDYYKHRENTFKVGNYLARQPKFNRDSRAILIDWLVEIQETFELNHETLYLSVKLLDIYLDKVNNVKREKLQLIGSAAVFVASKFDERSPPLIEDFIYMSQETYDHDELLSMEREFLRTVDFDLGAPISYRFLRRYARVTKIEMSTLTLARYILETSLMFLDFCRISESKMAAASYLLAVRMKKIGDWSPVLEKYTGYTLAEIEPLMWALNHMIIKRKVDLDKLDTVYKKYSHEIFYEVALVESLPSKIPISRPIAAPANLLV